MSGVFINYRVGDEPMAAQLLCQSLVERFGEQNVFYASTSIPPGRFFDDEILGAVQSCDVLVSVIGPRWLSVADENGVRRIDDPQDWVRREIAIALRRGIPVVPLLVQDAALPASDQLPEDIRDLTRCNYRRLGHRFGRQDLAAIGVWLERLLAAPVEPAGDDLPDSAPGQPARVQMRGNASGNARIYMAGRDMTVNNDSES